MIGKVIAGRYEVISLLGQGGMARVYRARDLNLGREVAVKALLEQISSDAGFRERFRREARAAAALQHPNIVQVYDFFECSEGTFIVMELVMGEDLRSYLGRVGALRIDDAIRITLSVLSALSLAHSKGLVHRDISARNVLLGNDGIVRVSDFGIARVMGERTLTQAGDLVGSVQYISPEQARGDEADFRADLYAAGVLLFEMVCGRLPFMADNAVKMALKHIQEQPPLASSIRPEVSDRLDQVLARAMEKDCAKRFQSAAEMAAALESLRSPVPATPSSSLPADVDDIEDLDVTLARPALGATAGAGAERFEPIGAAIDAGSVTMSGALAATVARPGAGGAIGGGAIAGGAIRGGGSIRGGGEERGSYPDFEIDEDLDRTADLSPEFLDREARRSGGVGSLFGGMRRSDQALEHAAVGGEVSGRSAYETEPLDAEADDPDAPDSEHPHRSKSCVISIVVLIAAIIGLLGSVVWATKFAQPRVEVPSVVGKTLSQARAILEKANLRLEIQAQRPSDTAKPGVILEQDPGPGTKLDRDTSVYVIVCQGAQMIKVPDLTGLGEERAREELSEAGLEYRIISEARSDVEAGLVFNQDPAPEVEVYKGTEVKVYVSTGDAGFTVPDIIGKSKDEAEGIILDLGGKLVVVGHKPSATVAENCVLEQSPAPGNKMRGKAELQVVLSSGKASASVPNLLGMTVDEARAKLGKLGISLQVEGGGSGSDTISSQEPSAGGALSGGAVVVSCAPSQAVVPDVVGLSLEQATAELRQSGLTVGAVSSEAGSSEPGVVLAQSTAAGAEVEPGTAVDLTIAVAAPSAPHEAPATPSGSSNSGTPSNSSAGGGGAASSGDTVPIPTPAQVGP